MLGVKGVRFTYSCSEDLMSLFESFRWMVNEAIKVGLEKKITSRFRLIKTVYEDFKKLGLHTHHILSACEIACAILKNHRKHGRKPYVKKLMLKVDNQAYKLEGDVLRIPRAPREFIELKLKIRDYHKQFLEDSSLHRGSVVVTPNMAIISFSKEAFITEPRRVLGIDINERTVDLATEQGYLERIDIKAIPTIQHEYRVKRERIQRNICHNLRKTRRFLAKLKGRQTRRIEAVLHKVSKKIVEYAKQTKSAIVLEKLKGLRKNHRKGNRKGRALRGRLNSWNYGKLQKFIEYKAKWEGILVIYVNPKGTSTSCSKCGCSGLKLIGRVVECPRCGLILDRDINASINIAKRGWVALFSHNIQPNEAMKQLKDVEPSGLEVNSYQS